jgi:hypothetical protein
MIEEGQQSVSHLIYFTTETDRPTDRATSRPPPHIPAGELLKLLRFELEVVVASILNSSLGVKSSRQTSPAKSSRHALLHAHTWHIPPSH